MGENEGEKEIKQEAIFNMKKTNAGKVSFYPQTVFNVVFLLLRNILCPFTVFGGKYQILGQTRTPE
jgi:hypothetical protein